MASTTLVTSPYWLSVTTVVFSLKVRMYPNQPKAVDFAHIYVYECNVVLAPMTSGENFLAIAACIHAMPGGFKDHFQITADIALVIGDQDASFRYCHWHPPFGAHLLRLKIAAKSLRGGSSFI